MSIQFARKLRQNQSKAEIIMWSQLRNRRFSGFKFRRQKPMGPYIVDFCCVKKKIVIEIDGGQHATQLNYDQKRSNYLIKEGYQVLRFWNNEVLVNTDTVMDFIWKKLNE